MHLSAVENSPTTLRLNRVGSSRNGRCTTARWSAVDEPIAKHNNLINLAHCRSWPLYKPTMLLSFPLRPKTIPVIACFFISSKKNWNCMLVDGCWWCFLVFTAKCRLWLVDILSTLCIEHISICIWSFILTAPWQAILTHCLWLILPLLPDGMCIDCAPCCSSRNMSTPVIGEDYSNKL